MLFRFKFKIMVKIYRYVVDSPVVNYIKYKFLDFFFVNQIFISISNISYNILTLQLEISSKYSYPTSRDFFF